MAIENIREKRVGQIAVVCTDRERTAAFYRRVFGWEQAFGTESFMGELISEVQNMQNAAASTRWLIDSRPGFQLEIFQYACPESRPLPKDSSVSDQGYNHIIIATRSLADVRERLTGLDPQLAAAFSVDEADGKRALCRDPDGVLLEIFERPDWVPAADHSVMLGVGVTVNDLELFSEDLVQGFSFQPEGDLAGPCGGHDSDKEGTPGVSQVCSTRRGLNNVTIFKANPCSFFWRQCCTMQSEGTRH